jgi:opacity protein-like surface antigen
MKHKSIVLMIAALFLSTSAAYAVPQQKRSSSKVVTGAIGGSIGQIRMKSSDGNSTFTNVGAWTDLPNATLKMSVPRGQFAYIAARFTAESNCRAVGAGAYGWCSIRILVNNREMLPAAGIGYAFDTPDNSDISPQSTFSYESHALERSSVKLGPGVYTVKVQYRTVGDVLEQWIGDWHFTAKRIDP